MNKTKKEKIKKNKQFVRIAKIFAFICALIIIVCGVGILLYSVGSFPDFNQHIDSVLTKIIQNKDTESINNAEQKNVELEKNSLASVFDKSVIFSGLLLGEIDFSTPEIISKNKLAENEWNTKDIKYNSQYPIVTNVCKFSDCYIFLDAKPSLIQVNIQTGEIKQTSCPVYPGAKACIKDSDYVFEGRDGRQYVFSFDTLASDLDTIKNFTMFSQNTDEKKLSYYMEKVAPNLKLTEAILDNLANWADYSENDVLPKMHFIDPDAIDTLYNLETNTKDISMSKPTLFVFSPNSQGVYKIGLCDKKGSWLKKRAYVAIFTKDELSLVSLDYKSDEPQIQLQLSNRQLYYIVTGLFNDSMTIVDDSEGFIKHPSNNENIEWEQMFLKIEAVD